jgi:hypothetical protein
MYCDQHSCSHQRKNHPRQDFHHNPSYCQKGIVS